MLTLEQLEGVGDGAVGTMLQAAGLPLDACPERWNLERPRAVARVHADYAAAGARWLTTNTFGGNRVRLERAGLASRVREVNAAAVAAARTGAPDARLLASIGPTGSFEPADWQAAFEEQVEALAGTEIDGFLVETIVGVGEGAAAVRATAAAGIGPVVACFTPGADGALLDGTSPEAAAEALVRAGASAVGVNCGSGPESLLEPARRLVAAAAVPVAAVPSAGLPKMVEGRAVYGLPTDSFARAAIQFREVGVRLFAGCCGTTPAHIRAAAQLWNNNE